jgi:hypothetical protein
MSRRDVVILSHLSSNWGNEDKFVQLKKLKILRHAFYFIVICILVIALSSPVSAQVSFSSTYNVVDRQLNSDRSVRLFSESNGGFVLSALGCRWDVSDYVDRNTRRGILSNDFMGGFKNAVTRGGQRIIIYGSLSNGRRLYPSKYNCYANSDYYQMIGLVEGRRNDGSIQKAVSFIDSDGRSKIWLVQTDVFTPAQEEKAWNAAGGIGLEILKAWLTQRRR